MDTRSVECRWKQHCHGQEDRAQHRADGALLKEERHLPVPEDGERGKTDESACEGKGAPPVWQRRRECDGNRTRERRDAGDHVQTDNSGVEPRTCERVTQQPRRAFPSVNRIGQY
jgi:hypothetical protein